MKGVIASRTDAPLFDLSHDIDPFDVLGAAWFLRNVCEWWPAGTIFVCVVDPGVGTARSIVAMEQDGRFFLAPDNGLLMFVRSSSSIVHEVVNEALFTGKVSNTFHGRDRFAPVAAELANGMPLGDVGPRVEEIALLPYEPPSYGATVHGTVVAIDRFGNVITDIEADRVPFSPFELVAGSVTLDRLERNYGDARPGPFLIVGSSGHIEISVANGSAVQRLRIRRLDRVDLRPLPV